jgi:hypothetical protein
MRIVECMSTNEWAMVGALGIDELTGIIPRYHRAATNSTARPATSAFCQRSQETSLKAQNCDKGLDKFVRKFNPKGEMEAIMFVALGCRENHGWAVYCT